jgi:hypothetical protein
MQKYIKIVRLGVSCEVHAISNTRYLAKGKVCVYLFPFLKAVTLDGQSVTPLLLCFTAPFLQCGAEG